MKTERKSVKASSAAQGLAIESPGAGDRVVLER